jgi:hypothetical protein
MGISEAHKAGARWVDSKTVAVLSPERAGESNLMVGSLIRDSAVVVVYCKSLRYLTCHILRTAFGCTRLDLTDAGDASYSLTCGHDQDRSIGL